MISAADIVRMMREGAVRTTDDSIPAIRALQLEAGDEETRGQGEEDPGVDTLVVHPDEHVRVSAHHVRDRELSECFFLVIWSFREDLIKCLLCVDFGKC